MGVHMMQDNLGAFAAVLVAILLVFLLCVIIAGIVILVYAQSMSDEERIKIGLGPKGQGR
jgi:hypothetical protein